MPFNLMAAVYYNFHTFRLPIRLACLPGEGSSSEDTSDEAYAYMHKLMEEDEHRRYAAAVAGREV